jgi:hypothetical protein
VGFRDHLAQRRRFTAGFVVLFAATAGAWVPRTAATALDRTIESGSKSEQSPYGDAHPYVDAPIKQILKRIPQLRDLQPAPTQQELPTILQRTGDNVDSFFRRITDLTAREEISLTRLKQEKPYTKPELSGERVRDTYLILRHGSRGRAEVVEYRTDAKGDNFDQVVGSRGFLVTSGFALICNYFSTAFQSESTFRYLGDERIGPHDTYVRNNPVRPLFRS